MSLVMGGRVHTNLQGNYSSIQVSNWECLAHGGIIIMCYGSNCVHIELVSMCENS